MGMITLCPFSRTKSDPGILYVLVQVLCKTATEAYILSVSKTLDRQCSTTGNITIIDIQQYLSDVLSSIN